MSRERRASMHVPSASDSSPCVNPFPVPESKNRTPRTIATASSPRYTRCLSKLANIEFIRIANAGSPAHGVSFIQLEYSSVMSARVFSSRCCPHLPADHGYRPASRS